MYTDGAIGPRTRPLGKKLSRILKRLKVEINGHVKREENLLNLSQVYKVPLEDHMPQLSTVESNLVFIELGASFRRAGWKIADIIRRGGGKAMFYLEG